MAKDLFEEFEGAGVVRAGAEEPPEGIEDERPQQYEDTGPELSINISPYQ